MQLRFPIAGQPPTEKWSSSEYIFIHFKFKNCFFVCETCVIRFCSGAKDDVSHWSIYTCTYAFTQNVAIFISSRCIDSKTCKCVIGLQRAKTRSALFFWVVTILCVSCFYWNWLHHVLPLMSHDLLVCVCVCAVDKPFCCSCCCKMLIWIIHEKSIHIFFVADARAPGENENALCQTDMCFSDFHYHLNNENPIKWGKSLL